MDARCCENWLMEDPKEERTTIPELRRRAGGHYTTRCVHAAAARWATAVERGTHCDPARASLGSGLQSSAHRAQTAARSPGRPLWTAGRVRAVSTPQPVRTRGTTADRAREGGRAPPRA